MAVKVLLLVVLTAVSAQAQERRIDWPSSIALAVGQAIDGATTTAFLTGHGQSDSHAGPCVEGNQRFQPGQHQLASAWAAKASVVALGVVANVFAERYANSHPGKHGTFVRWFSRGVNYYGAGLGVGAGVFNLAHCGVL